MTRSDVLNGYNGTIFAYGQTGSGKTFTMYGPDNPTSELIGTRALSALTGPPIPRSIVCLQASCRAQVDRFSNTSKATSAM